MDSRFKLILRTSIIGIVANLFLAGFKVLIGTIANSIAIVLDGVNNLSDAASSIITIIGTALAGKSADKKHPFGYGRIEYLTSMVISAIVLYAGITSLVESVKKIITPEKSDYSTVALVVIAVAIVVKIALSFYVRKMGEKANSDSLIASGKDALMDAVLSAATLLTAIIFLLSGISLEAWLGAIISLVIIKAGAEMLRETISKILGEPGDAQLVIDMKKTILALPGVNGVFDVVLNNYGPETHLASLHVDVDDTHTVTDLDKLSRKIMEAVKNEHNIVVTAVGFYSRNTINAEAIAREKEVREIAMKQPCVKGFHGFYVDFEEKVMSFDLVITLDTKERRQAYENAVKTIQNTYPDYVLHVGMDMDMQEAVKA